MNARPIFRWLAILGLGGFGVFILMSTLLSLSPKEGGSVPIYLGVHLIMILISWPFLAAAYFLWRKQYQQVCTVVSWVMAFIAYGLVDKHVRDPGLANGTLYGSFALAVFSTIAGFVLAVYAGRCAYQLGQAYLPRIIGIEKTPNRTGAPTG